MKNANPIESRLGEGAVASKAQRKQDRPCCRDRCTAEEEAFRCRKAPVTLSNAQAHDVLRFLRYERANIVCDVAKSPSIEIFQKDLEAITNVMAELERQL